MQTIVSHAMSYLQISGVLVISHNERDGDGITERGTVWRRSLDGLQKLFDSSCGSEFCGLIARFEKPHVSEATSIPA